MLFFRKLFRLPTPKELGWSDSNALESREFSDEPQGKTWEDWDEYVKEHYPVRYFLAETLADFIKYNIWWKVSKPVGKFWYWLKCHTLPSYRFHFLDMRQPDWRYGWRDVPEKMLCAIFNLLGEYLNKEGVHDLTQWYSRDDINKDPGMKQQQDAIDEARMIYRWWTIGRGEEQKAIQDMLHKWHDAKKGKDPQQSEYWGALKLMEEGFETKTDEMIARVMKIRRTLWT